MLNQRKSDEVRFEVWIEQVDAWVKHLSRFVGVDDLPDWLSEDAYDEDLYSKEAAEKAIEEEELFFEFFNME
jgi:hypothetical protein